MCGLAAQARVGARARFIAFGAQTSSFIRSLSDINTLTDRDTHTHVYTTGVEVVRAAKHSAEQHVRKRRTGGGAQRSSGDIRGLPEGISDRAGQLREKRKQRRTSDLASPWGDVAKARSSPLVAEAIHLRSSWTLENSDISDVQGSLNIS